MTDAPPERLDRLTVAEAARRLGVTPGTVRNLLYKHGAAVSRPVYGRRSDHPRQLRLLHPEDLDRLSAILGRSVVRGVMPALSAPAARVPPRPPRPDQAERTALYAAYAGETLLYIGVANDWARRWVVHGIERPAMFEEVTRLEIEYLPTRAAALAKETELLRNLRPPHNSVPSPRVKPFYRDRKFYDAPRLSEPPADLSRAGRWRIEEAAGQLGVMPKTVRNLLSEFKGELESPTYVRGRRAWRVRLISDADVYRLRELLACWTAYEDDARV